MHLSDISQFGYDIAISAAEVLMHRFSLSSPTSIILHALGSPS